MTLKNIASFEHIIAFGYTPSTFESINAYTGV